MAPQQKYFFEYPEFVEHVHPQHNLEEKKLHFNFQKFVDDLRNLDYSKVVWRNVIMFSLLHVLSVYGLVLVFTTCSWNTIVFSYILYTCCLLGVTMGTHRLWSHRSLKANLLLRVILAVFQTMSFQNDIYEWSRDHRVHHKYSETDADPHNANRGFFFAHIGWLLCRKHPDVIKKGHTIDLSDLLADPVVRIQRQFYLPLVIILCFILPTVIPFYFWTEDLITGLIVAGILRYCITLHASWMVNSLAHWIGAKPYDKTIGPSQNAFVATLTFGEGWHNFHHVFPQDYRTAELGGLLDYNLTTYLIDFCAALGWVWDRKIVPNEVISKRATRTGDYSYVMKSL